MTAYHWGVVNLPGRPRCSGYSMQARPCRSGLVNTSRLKGGPTSAFAFPKTYTLTLGRNGPRWISGWRQTERPSVWLSCMPEPYRVCLQHVADFVHCLSNRAPARITWSC